MKILFHLTGLLAVVTPFALASQFSFAEVSHAGLDVDAGCGLIGCAADSAAVVHQDSSSQRGSSKCGAARLRTFFEEVVGPCYKRADNLLDYDNVNTLGQLYDINCKHTNAQVNCWFSSETSVCLSDEEKQNGAISAIRNDFKFAYNKTRVSGLGDNYVASCPILRDNEDEVTRRRTGSNTCDFGRAWMAETDHFECIDEAKAEETRKLDSLEFASDSNKGNIIVDALCTSRATYLGRCMNILSPCFSSVVRDGLRNSLLESLGKAEAIIGNGFSYNRVCGPANRRRRSAGIDIEAVKEYLSKRK